MASYPTSKKTFTRVDNTSPYTTVLEASLLTQIVDEITAIENEIGPEAYGICGSVAERINFELSPNGGLRNAVQNIEHLKVPASLGARRRITGGYERFQSQTGTVTFADPFPVNGLVPDGAAVFCTPGQGTPNATHNTNDVTTIIVTSVPPIYSAFNFKAWTSNGGSPSQPYYVFYVAIEIAVNYNAV